MESSLVLTAGEEVKAMVKGELFAVTTDIITNIILKLQQFVFAIFGIRMEAQLIVTNKRVVLETKRFTCWCIPDAACFKSIPNNGISSVEYAFAAMCVCGLCRKYTLTVTQNSGEAFGFVLKGGEAEASSVANTITSNF